MSLGWGLRGSIGGGSLGAMIPGAMIGLVICLLLNRHADAGLIASFAAIVVTMLTVFVVQALILSLMLRAASGSDRQYA